MSIIKNLGWSSIGTFVKEVFTLGTLVYLIGILDPADFGIVAMAMVFAGFSNVLMDFGFGQALIQKPKVSDLDFSSVFWINIATGAICTCVLYLCAPLLASFYQEERVSLILKVFSIQFFASSLIVAHKVKLQRNLKFKLISILDSISVVSGAVVAILLASLGYGYWSLVFQSLAAIFSSCILYWRYSLWTPKFVFSQSSIKSLSEFSVNVFLNRSLFYWTGGFDKILIGKFLGDSALGLYKNASSIVFRPVSTFLGVISRVLFPSMSKMNSESKNIANLYVNTLSGALFGLLPILSLIYLLIDDLASSLKEEWLPAVNIVRILCFSLSPLAVTFISESVYMAKGKSKLMLNINIFFRFILIAGFVFGLKWGLEGLAISIAIAYIFRMLMDFYFISKIIKISLNQLNFALSKIIISGLIAFAPSWYLDEFIHIGFISHLALVTCVFLSVFLTVSYIFRVEVFSLVIGTIKKRVNEY